MRFLGVLGLGGIEARLVRHIVASIEAADDLAGLVQGLGRGLDAVRPHVGDQADRLAADVDALIELLGGLHGALRVEAQFARGFLLKGRGRERRRRRTLGGTLFDGGHGEGCGLYGLTGGEGRCFAGQIEFG